VEEGGGSGGGGRKGGEGGMVLGPRWHSSLVRVIGAIVGIRRWCTSLAFVIDVSCRRHRVVLVGARRRRVTCLVVSLDCCCVGLVGWAHAVRGEALSSVGAARSWVGVVVCVVGVVVEGVKMEVVGARHHCRCRAVVLRLPPVVVGASLLYVGKSVSVIRIGEGSPMDDERTNNECSSFVIWLPRRHRRRGTWNVG
jgi:hypothetical protein